MVANMNVGASLYGALAYNGQKVNEGEGKLLVSNKIFDDGTGTMDIAVPHRILKGICLPACVPRNPLSISRSTRIRTTS